MTTNNIDRIRLCIGTNDGETIAKTHMGDTGVFHIYDIYENSDSKFIEKRENIAKEMEHDTTNKMKNIIELIKDAQVFVAQQKSPNFVRIAKSTKHQPVVVKSEKISDLLEILKNKFTEIATYVTRRNNGERFDTIPQFGE